MEKKSRVATTITDSVQRSPHHLLHHIHPLQSQQIESKVKLLIFFLMRTLSPNLDREDGLDTILEVPIPKEPLITVRGSTNKKSTGCTNLKSWVRPQTDHRHSYTGRGIELQLLLGVIGAPLIPLPVRPSTESLVLRHNKNDPLEVSTAKYIVQQYIAASGGEKVLSSKGSMYAMGKVRMIASDFCPGGNKKATAKERAVGGELGGFVLWQKKPDMWCLELVVSGCKISAGSNGKVAWRQTPWQQSHASRGPPRPLRRLLQGLDPLSTADLFSNASCIGEKTVHGEDCFVLRLDARASTLRARSSISIEIIRHTLWGCFSQRTGLLVQLEDTQLLKISSGTGEESIYWETTMESTMEDYRPIDGIVIAHSGRTATTLFRFSDAAHGNTRTLMEEWWTVEEVDFNIWGLSMDCFLPPGDLKEERVSCDVLTKNDRPLPAVPASTIKIRPWKVAAVDNDDSGL